MMRYLTPVLTIAIACGGLVSCSSLQTPAAGNTSGAAPQKKSTVAKIDPLGIRNIRFQPEKLKGFKFPSFGRKPTPPIVEVQKATPKKAVAKAKPSKKKSSNADAIAWKRKKELEKKAWKPKDDPALVPKDFKASDLDVDGQVPTYGILPTLSPGDETSIKELDEAAPLPADVLNLPEIPSMRPVNSVPDLSSVPDYLKPVGPVPAIKTGR
jgi:hypothetical protein